MGELERSGAAREYGLAWAITDIFTPANFAVAVVASLTFAVEEVVEECPLRREDGQIIGDNKGYPSVCSG